MAGECGEAERREKAGEMRALAARLCRGGVANGEKGDEGEAAAAAVVAEAGDDEKAGTGGLEAREDGAAVGEEEVAAAAEEEEEEEEVTKVKGEENAVEAGGGELHEPCTVSTPRYVLYGRVAAVC